MFGYVGLSLMLRAGWPPILALIVQMIATLLLATVLHVAIEEPTHRVGKTLGRRIMASPPRAAVFERIHG